MQIATKKEIYLPIAKEVSLLLGGKKPEDSLKDLLS
jgi:hypothetical protein